MEECPVCKEARRVCAEQAEDEGLWFIAERITEAKLQQALRRLAAVVEGPEGRRCCAHENCGKRRE